MRLARSAFILPLVAFACGDSTTKAPVTPVTPVVVAEAAASAAPSSAPSPAASSATPKRAEDDGTRASMWGPAIDEAFGGDAGAPFRVDAGTKMTRNVSLRQGAVTITGKLPAEVVHGIVRPSFGRFRDCYERGLRSNPKLRGTITVEFTIDRSGAVSKALPGASDLGDENVIACVVGAFAKLSFPQPEGGTVAVVYPIIYSPPEYEPPNP